MKYPTKIVVLNENKPFLCLLKAYNRDNFHWYNCRAIIMSGIHAFGVIAIILLLPTYILLIVWQLIDKGADFRAFAVGLPLIITFLQIELSLIALIVKNRTIIETIIRIQSMVDRRKFHFCFIFLGLRS